MIQSISDMLNAIKNGIKVIPSSTRVLFAVKNSENEFSGVLFSNKDYDFQNGVLKLKDECYYVDEYSFDEEDILELNGKRFYKYLKIKGT